MPLPVAAIDMPGEPVSASGQAGLQMAGLGVTLAISIVSGLITGNPYVDGCFRGALNWFCY